MTPYLTMNYANPGAAYTFGKIARDAVDRARNQVAEFINAKPEQIVFVSGGTEANNTVFASLWGFLKDRQKMNVLTARNEHDSVLRSATNIKYGFDVSFVPVNPTGEVSAGTVRSLIRDDTGLVSIMHTNNETGAISPIAEIGAACAEAGVFFHTDCVQAAGCSDLDVQKFMCDFMSISSHKIHGPKGVGALFVKDLQSLSLLQPLIIGGHEQEFGFRGGTENVAGIVGFGAACEYMRKRIADEQRHNKLLKQVFFHELEYQLVNSGIGVRVNGGEHILENESKTMNICIDGVDAETLLIVLDMSGVCASAGSACRSHEQEPSRTLLSMGIDAEDARNSIRVSFSNLNHENSVREAAKIVADKAKLLKGAAL